MTFPETALSVTVELYYSAAWNDISEYVYSRDRVIIRRGRTSPRGSIDPGTCTLTLDNRDGRFSPRNPTSPLYGLIGRNTPMRVSLDGSVRFYGEVSEWPVKWDAAGADVYIPITASGILRRLGQGASPLQSTMRRGIDSATDPVAYWPCEEGEAASSIASGLDGVRPMRVSGSPEFASYTGFYGSDALPVLGAASLRGVVPGYTAGAGGVRLLMAFPAAGTLANGTVLIAANATGTGRRWELQYETGGALSLHAFDEDDAETYDSGAIGFAVDGLALQVGFGMEQNGADVDWRIDTYGQLEEWASALTDTAAGVTIGRITSVTLGPGKNLTGVAVGHVLVSSSVTSVFDLSGPYNAYSGEGADDRFERLCTENGITEVKTGDQPVSMGFQGRKTLVELLQEVEDVDGVIREARVQAGLYYRTTTDITNQDSIITLDYETDMMAPFEPTDDDQTLRNRVTATRYLGSSATAEDSTSALGTGTPPAGVGLYDEAVTLSLARDDQAADHAAWRVHLGTWDEARYSTAHVSLARNYADRVAIKSIDISWPIAVENLPAWLPPGPVRLMVIGYEETAAQFEWDITYYCVPADQWDVLELEDATWGFIDTAGTTLAEDLTTTEMDVDVTASLDSWSTTTPYDIEVGGEVMTVTGVAGATLTVTRSVNGIVKTHATGAAVSLARPGVLSL